MCGLVGFRQSLTSCVLTGELEVLFHVDQSLIGGKV